MKRPPLDADLELFRDSARQFFQKQIRPNSERWREQGMVDREAFLQAGEMGYLCMWADEKYGGLGLKDFRYEQILIEENGLHGDPGFFMTLHSRLVAPYFEHFGSEEQKQRLLPGFISGEKILGIAMTEPDAGSDLAGMKSHAEDKGDHWLLNGSKTYISNGINGDVFIVAAKTKPDQPHAVSLFIVEEGFEGFERGRNLKKMGMKSQDTAELFFRDCKVPKNNLLGQAHAGFYHLMQGLAEERLIAAVGNLTGCRAAFEVTREFVRDRKAFGKPLSKFQNTRFKLAEIDAEMDMSQVYVDRMVEEHNIGKLNPVDASRAKLLTSELAGRMVDLGVQLHGGAGYMDEYPICRMYQ
ncbi:MAG: acyl-CoA dehydrogenase family protein, partial [Oceanococcus sp.]